MPVSFQRNGIIMLPKLLHSHLDEMDAIEQMMKEDIDKIISAIDKDLLLSNPQEALNEVVEEIKRRMEEEYIPMASQQGVEITKTIKKYEAQGKEIVIDDSNNPQENKGILDDKNDGKGQD